MIPDPTCHTLATGRMTSISLITDDWSGYAKPGERGYCHTAIAERGGTQVAYIFLPRFHLALSRLKTSLCGIHHGATPRTPYFLWAHS